jgi:choline dehydrogenase-like flavoprotein
MVPKDIANIVLYGANKYYFNYTTTPQTFLDGATRTISQGRLVGGGSSVNAMVWQRGFKADFDAWAALGNVGWGWDDLLPYFKKVSHSRVFNPRKKISGKLLGSLAGLTHNSVRNLYTTFSRERGPV